MVAGPVCPIKLHVSYAGSRLFPPRGRSCIRQATRRCCYQDAKQLRIVHEKGGAAKATYAEIPFGDVTSVLYERSKSPRVKTAIFLSPLALFAPGKKHWLTIEYKGGYSYMRLDKKNQRQVRAALGAAGFEVEAMVG